MNTNIPEAGKSINRLSERRGLGSLTLNQESVLKLGSATSEQYGNEVAETVIDENARSYPVVSSKRKKMSYFRSMQQQDGADLDGALDFRPATSGAANPHASRGRHIHQVQQDRARPLQAIGQAHPHLDQGR